MDKSVNLIASRYEVLIHVDIVRDSQSNITGEEAVMKVLDIEGVEVLSIVNRNELD